MATLETQYKSYMEENPNVNLTFEDWCDKVYMPMILLFKQTEYEEFKEWDVTLEDGLDDLPYDDK